MNDNPQRKTPGNYLRKIEDVPKEIREYAINKLNPVDEIGNRIKDDHGNPITARISTAKENGSYYGPVILNNEKFIVQAVGKERLSAVVHNKDDVALQGASLALLDAKKTMNGTSIQIHYNGDKSKAYPWADKNKNAQAKEAIKADDFINQAADYARKNIKNTNQREAFLKHLGNVTQQVFDKNQPQIRAKAKTMPAPEQTQTANNGIER